MHYRNDLYRSILLNWAKLQTIQPRRKNTFFLEDLLGERQGDKELGG